MGQNLLFVNSGQLSVAYDPTSLCHDIGDVPEFTSITAGVQIFYASSVDALLEELAMVKPTWLFAVPRVFEKVYNGAAQKADADGKVAIFDFWTAFSKTVKSFFNPGFGIEH